MNKASKNSTSKSKPKAKKKRDGCEVDSNGVTEEALRHPAKNSHGGSKALPSALKILSKGLPNGVIGPTGGNQITSSQHNIPDGKLKNDVEKVSSKVINASENGSKEKSAVSIDAKHSFSCSYCCISFPTQSELLLHCRTQEHQATIMSDDGHDWQHRPPPRGLTNAEFKLCSSVGQGWPVRCRLGEQCIGAHSEAELAEWQQRFEYRALKLQEAREKHLHGASYSDQLLDRLSNAQHQHTIVTDETQGIVAVHPTATLCVSEKTSSHIWELMVSNGCPLSVVALLHDTNRSHFSLASVARVTLDNNGKVISKRSNSNTGFVEVTTDGEIGYQEWCNPNLQEEQLESSNESKLVYQVCVKFQTDIYGTFRQTVILDLGKEPVLLQRLCADVIPVNEMQKLEKTKNVVISQAQRWCKENATIIRSFDDPSAVADKDPAYNDLDNEVLALYPPPTNMNFVISQSTLDKAVTKENYRSRFHDLLYMEEIAQFELMRRFNIKMSILATRSYILMPSTSSMAKYAPPGELFARLELSSDISEDSPHGRLILTNCNSILIAAVQDEQNNSADGTKPKRVVFEAIIEDKTKKEIYVKLNQRVVEELQLVPEEEVTLEVQFQLNRLPLAEMHFAVDRIHQLGLLFLDPDVQTVIPQPSKADLEAQFADTRLNPKQREAVIAMTAPVLVPLPPILLIGPFGTGKTYTLAQALKQIVQQQGTRVLICTHSNSASDLYIREYLHPFVKSGLTEAKPLRIYYRHRWVATVHSDVQKYCLIEMENGMRRFVMPTQEQVLQHRVVVTTLNTSRCLFDLGLDRGSFTHILVDEAAQAMECEAITPLVLAGPNTRVVLAGDYMQLSPEVFSPFCEEKGLGLSLLERLYDHYPADHPCKILLLENYRSHPAIIKVIHLAIFA
ncbi:hypothetical protein HAZT_HAZT002454 [Hyalella azteca]|uniref:C2H2-type domain-containing protein n=1 Tax=Hyalella azteca TaxID=294128 RepID=A0A6A0H1W7_HYAAZ|nr:hypothetical protein HAZT_HAZT002454 [Hyalella azteca]